MACCASPAAFAQAAFAYEEPLAITEREIAGFNRLFQTSPAQKEAAQSLADASKTDLKAQEAKQGKIGEAWRALPKERKTTEARERLVKDLNAAEPDTAGARTKLMADLKAILTDQQVPMWKKFEYFLRRERWLTHHFGSLDHTNLIALVDLLGLAPEDRATIAPVMDRYEREMDAVLTDMEREYAAINKAIGEIFQREQRTGTGTDMEARKAAFSDYAAVHHRMVVLNDDCVRLIAAVVPEGKAKQLRQDYDRMALPESLGLCAGNEGIRLAPDLKGLDEPTRERIARMVREYSATYDALSSKIEVIERSFRLAQPGATVDTENWDPLRIERGDLQGRTQQTIHDLLTEEQWMTMLRAGDKKEKLWRESMSR